MQPGQFLVNKDGEKMKILFVNGDLIIPSKANDFNKSACPFTKDELEKLGWTLLEEPWVPEENSIIWVVNTWGDIHNQRWGGLSDEEKEHVLKTGNYARTAADAELYKQKLIERMGSKEN